MIVCTTYVEMTGTYESTGIVHHAVQYFLYIYIQYIYIYISGGGPGGQVLLTNQYITARRNIEDTEHVPRPAHS
jgi:hypothetical protein